MARATTSRSPSFAKNNSSEDERKALFDIIRDRSFGRGDVTLSSGKKSNFYFDMKPSMLDPKGAYLIAKSLLIEVIEVGGEYVGGLEMGAVPITGAICAYSHSVNQPVRGFFVRKRAKEHGAKKLVEGFLKDEPLDRKSLVVVEDVTTSGASALQAVDACRELGADVRLVISIVDREEGAAQIFSDRGIRFKSLFRADDFLKQRD